MAKKKLSNNILEVKNLIVEFKNRQTSSRVLNDISLSLKRGEILGIVGESGAGKSILAKSLIRLESPGEIISGSILIDNIDITNKTQKQMRQLRGKKISLALQNPKSAMDPVFTMGNQFKEVICRYNSSYERGIKGKRHILNTIYGLLQSAGIASPEKQCRHYPHEWSIGMLQRAQLLMVLIPRPDVLILDEITSSLDPTITIQIINIIKQFKKKQNNGIILITHDLAVAMELCNRIGVLKDGCLLETGTTREIFNNPKHKYTGLLVSSISDNITH